MKIVQAFKVAAIVLLLPAVGVAVAATTGQYDLPLTATEPETSASSADAAAGSSALADVVSVDGRQDSGSRGHWVWLDDSGNVTGKVSILGSDGEPVPVNGMDIKLFADDVEVHATKTISDGTFTIRGLEPGIYSLIGKKPGDEAQLYLGFYALPLQGREGEPDLIQIDALAVGGENKGVIDYIQKQNLPSISLDDSATSAERFAKVSRQSFYLPPVTERVNVSDLAQKVSADTFASTAILHHEVLAENGILKGELAQIVGSPIEFSRMNVYLVRNNEIVKTGEIDDKGSFTFDNVRRGNYAFVAAGQGGFACVSVEVTEVPEAQTGAVESEDGTQFVNASYARLTKRASQSFLSVALIPQEFVAAAMPAPQDDAGAPAPAGGFAGAPPIGGGGGGGGGGGLNLRRLALIGAGVAIPLALSDDNGDGGGQASPSTVVSQQ